MSPAPPADAPTPIDSRVRIVAPENIAFEYRIAGPFARVGAYLIDLLILAAICFGVLIASLFVGATFNAVNVGWFVTLVTWFCVAWFYNGTFEWLMSGQTPGKRMTGLRVLQTDGRPIAAWQAILRNLLRFVDLFPYATITDFFGEEESFFWPTCLVGLAAMACSRRHQRMGDLACSTMVVAEEPSGSGRAEKDWIAASGVAADPALQQVLASLPASYRPGRTLAKALSHYAGRRRYLGPGRRREIARHVGEPLAERLSLPADTDHDLLLCALYVRAFLTESEDGFDSAAEPQTQPQPQTQSSAIEGESVPEPLSDSSGLGEKLPRFQPDPVSPEPVKSTPVPGSPGYRSLLPKPPTPSS